MAMVAYNEPDYTNPVAQDAIDTVRKMRKSVSRFLCGCHPSTPNLLLSKKYISA
jgi:hypothetical protein